MRWFESPSAGAPWSETLRPAPPRSLCRCPVCGFAELRFDEVAHRCTLELTECPRCEHRATRALPSRMQTASAPAGLDGETAAAA